MRGILKGLAFIGSVVVGGSGEDDDCESSIALFRPVSLIVFGIFSSVCDEGFASGVGLSLSSTFFLNFAA